MTDQPNAMHTYTGAKLPQLYKSWFDGSIVNDASNAIKAALKDVSCCLLVVGGSKRFD